MTAPIRDDKPLSEHTEVERQIIRYGFFRNTGRMEEAEECFRKIQAMLRSLPTAAPDCIGAQIANDTARALDDVAAKIMTGRNMAEKEARAVTSGARMLERLAIALPSAGAEMVPKAKLEEAQRIVGAIAVAANRLNIDWPGLWRTASEVLSEADKNSALAPTVAYCSKCGAKRPDEPCKDDGQGSIGCPREGS